MPHQIFSRVASALAAILLSGASLPSLACTMSASGINFAPINPISDVAVDSVGTLTVDCIESTSYAVSLGTGEGSFQQRIMRSGTHTLQYNLFLDVNRQQLWGDGSGATFVLSAMAGTEPGSHSIYARVPAQPLTYVGSYSDAVLIAVEF